MDPKLYMALSSSDEEWYCNDCTNPFNFTDYFSKPRVALMTLMFLPTKKVGPPQRTVATHFLSVWC